MTTPSQIDVSTLREGETKAAHTPGPWALGGPEGDGDGGEGYIYCDNELGSAVAIVFGKKFPLSVFSREVEVANARLIAAAPDLLAAMRQCADIMRNNLGRQNEKLADVEPLLRAAIAKAGA